MAFQPPSANTGQTSQRQSGPFDLLLQPSLLHGRQTQPPIADFHDEKAIKVRGTQRLAIHMILCQHRGGICEPNPCHELCQPVVRSDHFATN